MFARFCPSLPLSQKIIHFNFMRTKKLTENFREIDSKLFYIYRDGKHILA